MSRVDPILALLLSPFVASMLLLLGLGIYAVSHIDRARRDRRAARDDRVRAARVEATRLSLAYLTDPVEVERVRQVVAAETAKARRAESVANQREAAPWFDGGAA